MCDNTTAQALLKQAGAIIQQRITDASKHSPLINRIHWRASIPVFIKPNSRDFVFDDARYVISNYTDMADLLLKAAHTSWEGCYWEVQGCIDVAGNASCRLFARVVYTETSSLASHVYARWP
jgi:hypothetical protein